MIEDFAHRLVQGAQTLSQPQLVDWLIAGGQLEPAALAKELEHHRFDSPEWYLVGAIRARWLVPAEDRVASMLFAVTESCRRDRRIDSAQRMEFLRFAVRTRVALGLP